MDRVTSSFDKGTHRQTNRNPHVRLLRARYQSYVRKRSDTKLPQTLNLKSTTQHTLLGNETERETNYLFSDV